MDSRPALKQDVDDLKVYLDGKFSDQAKSRARMYDRLESGARVDVAHGLKIETMEKRLDRFFKAISGIGAAVVGKVIYDVLQATGNV